jgi:quinol monooxygenase YgiN
MPTITHADGRVTMINLFTVKPEECEMLIQILTDAIRRMTAQRPGFVSASLHASLDGTRVVNYTQWQSRAAFEALERDTAMRAFMEEIKSRTRFARADANIYEVRVIVEAPPGAA